MTYLELCQMVARESGTIPTGQPSSVTGQSGRLDSVVRWTAQSWVDVQNRRSAWLWMVREFDAELIPGVQQYSAADLGVDCLGEWLDDIRVYDPEKGLDDESSMWRWQWRDFYARRMRGEQKKDRPNSYGLAPNGGLAFWPSPDRFYRVRGLYRGGVQRLAANDDRPEMPERFHELIAWRALVLLAISDESVNQFPAWEMRAREMMAELERDQLPEVVETGGPLA